MPFNRYLEDELDYVEKWGNSIREVVTEYWMPYSHRLNCITEHTVKK